MQPPATPNIWGNDVTWQQILSSRPTSVAAMAPGSDAGLEHLMSSYDRSLVSQLQLDDVEY